MRRPLSIAIVTLVLASVPAAAFHADDLVPVHALSVAGGESRAARVELAGPSLAVDVDAEGPLTGAQGSFGLNVYDASGARRAHVTFTRLGAPDRAILTVLPDASLASEVEIVPGGGRAGSCSLVCLGIRVSNLPSGEYAVVAWAAGIERASLRVLSTGGGRPVAEAAGDAFTFGDWDFSAGAPSAQAQETVAGQRAGAKAMHDARLLLDAQRGLHGIFYSVDFKTACQFALGTCVYESTVKNACARDLGVSCETTRLAWSGPTGGRSGGNVHGLDDLPAGAYRFDVDLKLDAYGPRAYEPASGTFLYAGEDYTILTFADVAVP